MTFAPKEPPPPAYRHNLELGGRSYMLYTYSFLNFGQVGSLIYNTFFWHVHHGSTVLQFDEVLTVYGTGF